MNLIEQIQQAFVAYLIAHFNLDHEKALESLPIINADESKKEFGDLNSNAALMLARQLKRNPREIAQEIAKSFAHHDIEKIEVAGAGFINLFIKKESWHKLAADMLVAKEAFFKPAALEQPEHYNIEFVSANPTGPLHFGHGRSGIIGDVLGTILRFLGHRVTKEFYINDAGAQIQKLGKSFKARLEQCTGKNTPIPEDGYHGEYLIELAQECIKEHGPEVVEKDMTFLETYAKDKLLERIKQTLINYGIVYDVWFSEKTLHTSHAVEKAVDLLKQQGHCYEQEGALWFRSTTFGDDKDRVIRKSTGEWTYIAADIAYLLNKIERGFNHVVFVLGHDHHSYAVRLESIRQALGLTDTKLDTILYQLVKIKEDGELVKLSKRAGTIISLQDVIDTVGADVARFFYLHRKADAHLEFDLELARKKTDENPVYYVQYAYVRIGSIIKKAAAEKDFANISAADAHGLGADETLLLKKIVSLKNLLATIGANHQTHLLTYYLIELADIYHSYYSKHRIIELGNISQSRARLMLMHILQNTMETVLEILGISQPEQM